MGLDKAQDYVNRKRMHEIQDWGSVELDEEGKALQLELEARQTVSTSYLEYGQRANAFLEFAPASNEVISDMLCR